MEDDLEIRPEWEPYAPVFKVLFDESKSAFTRDIANKCPFAFLF
jgi:hypothetical protein